MLALGDVLRVVYYEYRRLHDAMNGWHTLKCSSTSEANDFLPLFLRFQIVKVVAYKPLGGHSETTITSSVAGRIVYPFVVPGSHDVGCLTALIAVGFYVETATALKDEILGSCRSSR